jgi:hypothetical protein
MRYPFRSLLAALSAVALAATVAAAQNTPVQTMAGILMNVNHFPSDAEKKTLQGIVENKTASEGERAVAQAMISLQHQVAAADKPKLEALVKDKATPEPVRTLASVILTFTHMATAADKEKLKKISSD